MIVSAESIPGVLRRQLTTFPDHRGSFAEVFREEWDTGIHPVQWNIVASQGGVMRGVHVHATHLDYFILLSGRAAIGLHDLRPASATFGRAAVVELSGERLEALTIPPGVAHGFYYREASRHLYSVSEYFNPADELGCHWADPALQIPWGITEATVSEHDENAPPLATLVEQLRGRI